MEGRLYGLDGMRGIAALLVVGFHVVAIYGEWQLFERAWLAVDFFFMLSGLVMARTYEDAMRDGRMGPLAFLAARYRRLWAPIAVGSLIGVALFLLTGLPLSGLMVVAGLALVPLSGARMFELNRPAWSIFFELIANGLHALVLHRVSTRTLIALALSCALFLLAARFGRENIFVGHRPSFFWFGIPRVLMAYCIGIALHRWQWTLPSPPGAAMLLLTVALLALPVGLAWDFLFVLLISPALIAMGVALPGGRVSAALGALSFPLYAVHYPMLQLSEHFGFDPLAGAIGAIGAAIVTALLIDRRLLRSLTLAKRSDHRAYGTNSISS